VVGTYYTREILAHTLALSKSPMEMNQKSVLNTKLSKGLSYFHKWFLTTRHTKLSLGIMETTEIKMIN
jgi:hypothetical protein